MRPVFFALTLVCVGALYPLSGTFTAPAAQQVSAPAAESRRSALPGEEESVKFAVIGDSGTGDRAQYQVAERLVAARVRVPFDFVIMLGDNLYGSERPSDYVRKFEQPYKPLLSDGVKFYAALGNHDEPAQRLYEPFNMGGERYYTFSKHGVDFFVLDSTYMSPAQLQWVARALEASDARWKIAYMHHPLYSSGERHGSELDLRAVLEPLFLKHQVNVVFAGHEHFYERLHPQRGIQYITQGGSAKLREGNIRLRSPMTAAGFDTDRSFSLVEIAEDRMYIDTISRLGAIVDAAVIPRVQGTVTTSH
jgi:hypothetical protein